MIRNVPIFCSFLIGQGRASSSVPKSGLISNGLKSPKIRKKQYYCKSGYFRWGKISRKCLQDISRGGNFHETTPISFIKANGLYFRVRLVFVKKTKAQKKKNVKITPMPKFPCLQYKSP